MTSPCWPQQTAAQSWQASMPPAPSSPAATVCTSCLRTRRMRTLTRSAWPCGSSSCPMGTWKPWPTALATHLVDLGAGPGVPIGLMMGRSAEMYIAMLAILKVSQPYMLVCASVNEAMAGNVPQDMMFCSTWRYKKPPTGSGNSPTSFQVAHVHTMRFGSTAKVLLKCKLKYWRISECVQAVCEPKIGRT